MVPVTDISKGVWMTDEHGTSTCLFAPTQKQLEFLQRPEPNALFWGSRGTGKSLCGRWLGHLFALMYPNFHYIILRRTYPELQKSHLVHIDREMKVLGGQFHHTNRIAQYANGSRGFFSHCQSEDDVLNLLSAEFALAIFDELSTFDWEMFLKLAASVRVPADAPYKALVRGLTNPLGRSTDQILKYFVNKDVDLEEDPEYNPNDWHAIHAVLTDNPYLDVEQYKKRFSGLPSHVKKAWLAGEFSDEEALFSFHPRKDGVPYHVLQELDLPKILKHARVYRAFDWGWSPDPSYCLWIAHLGNRYIAFHEKVWYKTTIPDLALQIKEEDDRLGIRHVLSTYGDPTLDIHTGAEIRTNREILESHGIPMEMSINNRELFASAIHEALATEVKPGVPRLQIYEGKRSFGCPYLVRSLPLMRYNPKHPMAMADHRHDHPVVSLAYFLISHASNEQRSFVPKLLKPWMRPRKTEKWVLGKDNVRSQ